jgi:hypothetical protein
LPTSRISERDRAACARFREAGPRFREGRLLPGMIEVDGIGLGDQSHQISKG